MLQNTNDVTKYERTAFTIDKIASQVTFVFWYPHEIHEEM